MSRLSPPRLRSFLAILAAGAMLALAACGDDDTTTTAASDDSAATSSDSTATGTALAVEADPGGDLAFTTDSLTSEAGSIPVDFTNDSGLPHNVAIEDADGGTVAETETITEGSTSTTAELEPGDYTFFCTVTGHREAGMEGTLTVE